MNWSQSSPCTPVIHDIGNWWLSISVWSYSHPIACCFLSQLLLVLCTIFICTSWVRFLVAALEESRWTNWCLRCCCVSVGGELDEALVDRLDWDPLPPGWGVCGDMIDVVEKVRKMITRRSGMSWGIYCLLQLKTEWVRANLHVPLKLKPTSYSSRLYGILTLLQFPVSGSNVDCVFTGICSGEQQLKWPRWSI